MEKLVRGVHAFQKSVFNRQKELFEKLAGGQEPQALFVCCSDSRVVPTLLTQSDPGDLFVLQNAGNLTPPYGAGSPGSAAAIEYAVSVLKVEHIIVCGHSQCGAMQALLNPGSAKGLSAIESWLRHAESTARVIGENYTHVTIPERRLVACVEENVLMQLENLRTHPCIAAALARGQLALHGWVYKFETGVVFAYDPDENQFVQMRA